MKFHIAKRTNCIHSISCWGIGALLCANLLACSSDSMVHDVEEPQDQIPMQFGQAAVDAPLTRAAATRAASTTTFLEADFLVSCFKGNGMQEVMNKYEVKFKRDEWENSSRWGYVGTKSDGFYQNQIQRYWDMSAFPYRFCAIGPCPDHNAINDFQLTATELSMPSSAVYSYATCIDGTLNPGQEPYYVADTIYTESKKVALPFHHLMSKVRFGIYCSKQIESGKFYLSNVRVKVISDGFFKEANRYKATLSSPGDSYKGDFKEKTKASAGENVVLLQKAQKEDLSKWNNLDNDHVYYAGTADGLLQIPQAGVKLVISFDINSVHYDDIVIALKGSENSDTFQWQRNNIYTYLINISDFSPLTVEFSAQLAPWVSVGGSLETNLEK